MEDKELLELAAKAVGLLELTVWSDKIGDYDSPHYGLPALHQATVGGECCSWNPLLDDGDALRLAVRLKLDTLQRREWIFIDDAGMERPATSEPLGSDPYAATRRAITRAAAEIGKAMP